MKKSLFFIALLFAGISAHAQYAYYNQATGFDSASTGVRNISVVDANVAWIASYDGSGGGANRTDFTRTTNGGVTWTPGTVPAPASYNWSMIHAHNADTAWAMYYDGVAGAGGGIFFTGDGGASWTQQGVGTIFNATSFPDVVYFWDGLQGVAMGDPNAGNEFEIYTTVDAGNTWTVVPAANIPNPIANEFGIVAHYSVVGNTIWFDTNKGRVYKSTDKGLTWTVSSTGITVPTNGAIDICFYDASNGIARLYDAATTVSTLKTTNDGGATWTAATPVGNFFGADVKHVPGTASTLMSTGIDGTSGYIGTSFSYDGGVNWVDFETGGIQRGAIGAVDSSHIWVGGFNSDPFTDGVYLYTYAAAAVACSDTNISAGVTSVDDSVLCFGESMVVTSTGVFSPNTGAYSGVSWIISSTDISGNNDPLNAPGVLLTYRFNFPAPATSVRTFTNDGSLIGTGIPYGTYYWTPVVFGNATVQNSPPNFLFDLVLDPSCTHTGTSVMVQVISEFDPACGGVPVSCTDLSITSGVETVNDTIICPGDTVKVTATGIISPTVGTYSGSCWIISSADISNSTDPVNDPSFITTYRFENASTSTSNRFLVNDGSLIDGTNLPFGAYYWTPVLFGNATTASFPPIPAFLQDLILDLNCIHTGTSLKAYFLDGSDPLCGVGIAENNVKNLSVTGFFNYDQNLNLIINSDKTEKANIRVSDVTGRIVFEKSIEIANGVNNEKINSSNFGAGLYIINVETSRATAVSKIVK